MTKEDVELIANEARDALKEKIGKGVAIVMVAGPPNEGHKAMNKQDIRLDQVWRHKTTGLEQKVICVAISGRPEDEVSLETRDGVCSGMYADELVATHVCQVMGWGGAESKRDRSTSTLDLILAEVQRLAVHQGLVPIVPEVPPRVIEPPTSPDEFVTTRARRLDQDYSHRYAQLVADMTVLAGGGTLEPKTALGKAVAAKFMQELADWNLIKDEAVVQGRLAVIKLVKAREQSHQGSELHAAISAADTPAPESTNHRAIPCSSCGNRFGSHNRGCRNNVRLAHEPERTDPPAAGSSSLAERMYRDTKDGVTFFHIDPPGSDKTVAKAVAEHALVVGSIVRSATYHPPSGVTHEVTDVSGDRFRLDGKPAWYYRQELEWVSDPPKPAH